MVTAAVLTIVGPEAVVGSKRCSTDQSFSSGDQCVCEVSAVTFEYCASRASMRSVSAP